MHHPAGFQQSLAEIQGTRSEPALVIIPRANRPDPSITPSDSRPPPARAVFQLERLSGTRPSQPFLSRRSACLRISLLSVHSEPGSGSSLRSTAHLLEFLCSRSKLPFAEAVTRPRISAVIVAISPIPTSRILGIVTE